MGCQRYRLSKKDFLRQQALELFGREAQLELAVHGDADAARLFRTDDGQGIALLRDS